MFHYVGEGLDFFVQLISEGLPNTYRTENIHVQSIENTLTHFIGDY